MNTEPYALLVEDDANTAHLIQTIMESRGGAMRLEWVSNGEEALDYLHGRGRFDGRETHAPAVLFIDLEMPRMDGLELLREIKADWAIRHLPVVVLAGSPNDLKLQQSYELGANAFVVKPMNYQQFTSFVRTLGEFWLTMNRAPRVSVGRPHHE